MFASTLHPNPCILNWSTITLTMFSGRDALLKFSPQLIEDVLVKKIIFTHDPDGRRIDSHALLRAMENVMCHATMSDVFKGHSGAMQVDNICNVEVVGSHEALGHTIYKISSEILFKCSGEVDLHARIMALFNLLGNFSWDAKVVLVLAAFATSYGEFWLIIQLYPLNPLAVLVAMLKQLPSNLSLFKGRFKALSLLVKTMVDVTRFVIELEGLRMQHTKLDDKDVVTTESQIYIAAYWVIKSALTCSSLITDLITMKHEQVNSSSTTIATWELSSLAYKLSSICCDLQKQFEMFQLQIEEKVHDKLLQIFKETHTDNQEVLRTLFSLKDDKPFKDGSSQEKLGVSALVDKVVVLLISKSNILPTEELFFLVHQSCCFPRHDESDRHYEIVWVPISSSLAWSDMEIEAFNHLSNNLPWYSIRQPWLLSSAVVNYMKNVWYFVDEPLMVVLDPHGSVISLNAIDLVFIWSAMAYPFSTWREEQLWEDVNWSIRFIIDGIDPLMSIWVEEGITVCLYGSDDLEWIREFTYKMKGIASTGVQLKLVYVGKRKPGDTLSYILGTIAQEKLSSYLSYPKIHFFWRRLESIRRSKNRLGKTTDDDCVLKEVMALMSHDNSERGWALMGEGSVSETVQFGGRRLMECLKLFPVWGDNIGKFGFLGAIRNALQPLVHVGPCYRCNFVPYVEGSNEGALLCEECKRPMEKLIVYQCLGT